MRCSQCGYHSFDGLENCKKCGEFLTKRGELFAKDDCERTSKKQPPSPQTLPLTPPHPVSAPEIEPVTANSESAKQRVFPTFLEARDHDGNFITDMDSQATMLPLFTDEKAEVVNGPSLIWRRIVATLCDLLILAALWWGFVAVGAWGLEQPLLTFVQSLFENLSLRISYYLIFIGSLLSYFTLLHWSGQTLGKMLLRLCVVKLDGQSLTLSESMFRSVGGLLSLLCGGWGYFSVLFDDEQRGWNDRIADTYVVLNDNSIIMDKESSVDETNGGEVSR